MKPVRLVVFGVIVSLVLTPVLGLAAGEVALRTWNKHPRHATGQHDDASPPAGKSRPGATAAPPPMLALGLVGWLSAAVAVVALSVVSRPPFVPPRS